MDLSTMVCLKSAQALTNRCFSSAMSRSGFLYTHSCMVLLLSWKPHRWHSTHIKIFKRNQSSIKCQCILWKIIHNGPILTKLCQHVSGVRFFKTQCTCYFLLFHNQNVNVRWQIYYTRGSGWPYFSSSLTMVCGWTVSSLTTSECRNPVVVAPFTDRITSPDSIASLLHSHHTRDVPIRHCSITGRPIVGA